LGFLGHLLWWFNGNIKDYQRCLIFSRWKSSTLFNMLEKVSISDIQSMSIISFWYVYIYMLAPPPEPMFEWMRLRQMMHASKQTDQNWLMFPCRWLNDITYVGKQTDSHVRSVGI
jgi:hypothetical protein